MAVRNALGVALPLAIGIALGNPSGGAMAATGALNVAFSDGSDPYLHRGRRMLTASLFVALAVFAGRFFGQNHPLAIMLEAACAFAAGMLVASGPTPGDIGAITLVTLIVFSASPASSFGKALSSGLLALAGALLQTVFALALWPVKRYLPESRALAVLYAELAQNAASSAPASESPAPPSRFWPPAPPWAPQTRRAPCRPSAISPCSVRPNGSAWLCSCWAACESASHAKPGTGSRHRPSRPCRRARRSHSEFDKRRPRRRRHRRSASGVYPRTPRTRREPAGAACPVTRSPVLAATRADARHQLDALTGQLASAVELAAHTSPTGMREFDRREAAQPWSLRLAGVLAVLRANLTLDSAAFRHALRLAVCVVIADAIARSVGWHRPYWAPMTVAIILKPDFSTTFSRGVLRLAGTFTGLALATVLFHADLTPAAAAGAVDRGIHVPDALGRPGQLRGAGDGPDRPGGTALRQHWRGARRADWRRAPCTP